MSPAKKAAHRMVAEIDGDELALRIAIACTGCRPPAGMTTKKALKQLAVVDPTGDMVPGFRRAALAAMAYWRECIEAGRLPS